MEEEFGATQQDLPADEVNEASGAAGLFASDDEHPGDEAEPLDEANDEAAQHVEDGGEDMGGNYAEPPENIEQETPAITDAVQASQAILFEVSGVKPAPGPSDEIRLLGLPPAITLDYDPIVEKELIELEARIYAEAKQTGDKHEIQTLKEALQPNCIRIQRDEITKQLVSNTNFVEFSDGTCALLIGSSVFECTSKASEDETTSWLVETTHDPLHLVHAEISERRTFRPSARTLSNAASLRNPHPAGDKRGARVTTVGAGAESEMRLKRQREEMLNAETWQSKKRKNGVTFDAEFLEQDD